MMLCPHCLELRDLKEVDDPDRGKVLRCSNPACADFTVPVLYAEEYAAHPPMPVSIIGLSGHGKTVFIESLLQEIQQLGARWLDSGFFFTWLDEVQMRRAYTRLRGLREGQLPKGTKTVFQQPQVIRLSNIPRLGGCQLIVFDTGGEAFLDSATLADAGKYVRNSPAVVWLLSLKRGDPYDTPDDVNQMMTVYLQTMARIGGTTKNQNLILVLTKGDELLARPDFPASAQKALAAPDYSPAGTIWGTLDQASTDIEAWLRSEKCGYHNLVNLVKSRFKSVRYCAVSAQGAPADGEALKYGLMPRGVLAPLLWLWRLDRDAVWQDRGSGEKALFLDVGEAIASAEGGAVQLEDRTYTVSAPLNIRKPVAIVGRGLGKTILEVTAPGYGIGIATAGKVEFRGLTIRRAGTAPGDMIRILAGDVDMTDTAVSGGIAGTSADGKPLTGIGILAAKQTRLTITASQVRSNHGNGILLIERSHARIEGCTFEGNGDAGVYARTYGSVAVARSVCRQNQTGIWIEAANAATVEANTCDLNGSSGITVSGTVGAGVVVRGNQCRQNSREGIHVRNQAAPTISDNTCSDNRRSGISFTDQAAGAARGNTCANNARHGIRIADDAAPVVAGNQATSNGECGLFYEDRAAGEALANQCLGNGGEGVRIEGTARPSIEDTTAKDNQGYGIVISGEKSRAEFDPKANVLDGNKKGALLDLRPKKPAGPKWWQ